MAVRALGETSRAGETKDEFLNRLEAKSCTQGDGEKKKLNDSYGKKLATLDAQIQRAGQTVEKQKGQRWQKIISALLSVITAIVGALGGRKVASQRNISAAATAARRAGSVAGEQADCACRGKFGIATKTACGIAIRSGRRTGRCRREV